MLFFFIIFSVFCLLGALGVLFFRNPMYCALSLVGSFFCLAAVYIMLNSEFVAVIQVLIYAGAIMVLFLFVLMLLYVRQDSFEKAIHWKPPQVMALLIGLVLLLQIGLLFLSGVSLGPKDIYTLELIEQEGSIEIIGSLLFAEYVLPLELMGFLLMIAIIGAVIIAKKNN